MTETTANDSPTLPYAEPVDTALGLLQARHLGLRLVVMEASIPPGFTFVMGVIDPIVRIDHGYTRERGSQVTVTADDGTLLVGQSGQACRLERSHVEGWS